jgi:hypothetical protein
LKAVKKGVVESKGVRESIKGIEQTKVKYTRSVHSLRNLFECQLKY